MFKTTHLTLGKVSIDIICNDTYFSIGLENFIPNVYQLHENILQQKTSFKCAIYVDTNKTLSFNDFNKVYFSKYDCILFIFPENKFGMYNSCISHFNHAIMKSTMPMDELVVFIYNILFDTGCDFSKLRHLRNDVNELSEREKTTIKLLSLGYDYQFISDMLGIKVKTVSGYYRAAIRKIGIKSISELMYLASMTPNFLS